MSPKLIISIQLNSSLVATHTATVTFSATWLKTHWNKTRSLISSQQPPSDLTQKNFNLCTKIPKCYLAVLLLLHWSITLICDCNWYIWNRNPLDEVICRISWGVLHRLLVLSSVIIAVDLLGGSIHRRRHCRGVSPVRAEGQRRQAGIICLLQPLDRRPPAGQGQPEAWTVDISEAGLLFSTALVKCLRASLVASSSHALLLYIYARLVISLRLYFHCICSLFLPS